MRRVVPLVVAAVSLTGVAVAAPGQPQRAVSERLMAAPAAVPGEVLVELAPGVARADARRLLAARDARLGETITGTDVSVVSVDPGISPEEAAGELSALPEVKRAEPNYLRFPAQGKPTPFPNDEFFAELWGLENTGQEHLLASPPPETAAGVEDADMDVLEAWEVQTGSPDTVIAVLDTGVDVTHPDLDESLWVNPDEIPGNGIDDDGNGFIDDVHGWDFGDDDVTLLEPDPTVRRQDHGTHVAGTIAAEMNNEIGVAGVCPGCRVMVLKGFRRFDPDGDGTDEMALAVSDELEALAYAQQMGADIVNGSFGAATYSELEREAFESLDDAGILSVIASGNANADNDLLQFRQEDGSLVPASPSFPASYDIGSILAVSASNHNDEYAYDTGCALRTGQPWACAFTNWGAESVDIVAPGTDILSTVPGNRYDVKDGTSMAAPHAAGVAGLVASQHPEYGALEIKNAILASGDHPPGLSFLNPFGARVEGRFTRTGARINALAALTASPLDLSVPADGNISGAVRIWKRKTGDVTWPEDVNDIYAKPLRKGRRYRAVLRGPAEADLDLIVYRPRARDIWQFDAFCLLLDPPCGAVLARSTSPGSKEKVDFKAKANKHHYLHVASYFGEGPYTLRIVLLPKKKGR